MAKVVERGREVKVTANAWSEKEVKSKVTKKVEYEVFQDQQGGGGVHYVYMVDGEHNPERCFATGPAFNSRVKQNKPTKFKVMTVETGLVESGDLKVNVVGEKSGTEAVVDLEDCGDNTYMVYFTCTTSENYNVSVEFYGQHIPGSPFTIFADVDPDPSKCRGYGYALDPSSVLYSGSLLEFFVDATEAGAGDLIVIIRGSREDPKAFISDQGTKVYSVKFQIATWGEYYANVWWSGKHIPGSPFPLIVHPESNADSVKVWGPGIQEYVVWKQPAEFHIDTKEAGLGTVTIRVQGPKDAFNIDATPISEKHHRRLIARYDPSEIGVYTIHVRWAGRNVPRKEVPGSPFTVNVFDPDAEEEEPSAIQGQDRIAFAGSELDSSSSDEDGASKDIRRLLITQDEALVYADLLESRRQVPSMQLRKERTYEGVKEQADIVVEGNKEHVNRAVALSVKKPKRKY